MAEMNESTDARLIRVLTPKEKQVVAELMKSLSNKEIAANLGTTENTVKSYLYSIFDKTGMGDRLELAMFVRDHPVLYEALTLDSYTNRHPSSNLHSSALSRFTERA